MSTITLIKLLFIEVIQSRDVLDEVTFDGTWVANLRGPNNRGYSVVSSSEDECGRTRAIVYLGMHVLREALEIQHKNVMLKGLIRDVAVSITEDAKLHSIRIGQLEKYKAIARPVTILPPTVDLFA